MSPEPVTTERIYARLKADVIGGRYPPRSELVVSAIADEFGVSISPVRDSAQRMVGELLLEPHPGGGFAIPDITEQGLRDLYFWHGQLLRNALNTAFKGASRPLVFTTIDRLDTSNPHATASTAAALFAWLGYRSRNGEHKRAIAAAGERLHAVRLKESVVLPDSGDELRAVATLTASGSVSDLIKAVWAYHRRRLRRIRGLVIAVGGTLDKSVSR